MRDSRGESTLGCTIAEEWALAYSGIFRDAFSSLEADRLAVFARLCARELLKKVDYPGRSQRKGMQSEGFCDAFVLLT